MQDASVDLETTRLADRARSGDADAFGALVELHHRAARRVALAALGNLADADEAVQDACLTAWRRIDRLDDPAAFRAWLLRITWRKAIDRRRSLATWLKRLRRDPTDADDPFATVAVDGDAPDEALLRASAIASSHNSFVHSRRACAIRFCWRPAASIATTTSRRCSGFRSAPSSGGWPRRVAS